MRKISRICRVTDQKCRAFFALYVFFGAALSLPLPVLGGDIFLPPPPKSAPPPLLPAERDPVLIRQKAREEKSKDEKESVVKAEQETTRKALEEKKKDEAQKPRDFYGFMELSLLQPRAVVTKGRSKYVSDATSHISSYVRLFWKSDATAVQPWMGLRIAPFGGYGTQNSRTARFAHTWMGPGLGIGNVGKTDLLENDSPTRSFWLLSGGWAAVARLVDDDEAAKPLPDDFKPSAWAYESPGAWIELRWSRIFRGALTWGVMAGSQTGKGKIFYYGGLTLGGFY